MDRALGRRDRFRVPPYVEGRVPEGSVDPSARPRFAAFQTDTIARLFRREGIGADVVPDLLFANYNQINEVGHLWGLHGGHMDAAVRSSDRALAELVQLLDRTAGAGEWVLVLTADHGSTPDASVTGAFRIDGDELVRDLRAAFDHDGDGTSAIAAVRVTQLWLRGGELSEGGFTPDDVARFLQGYTEADNQSGGADVPIFSAAFSSEALTGTGRRYPCGKPRGRSIDPLAGSPSTDPVGMAVAGDGLGPADEGR